MSIKQTSNITQNSSSSLKQTHNYEHNPPNQSKVHILVHTIFKRFSSENP
ncbi:hypothetical protein Hanom_Chr06g00546381 [Helianthus anomalus]